MTIITQLRNVGMHTMVLYQQDTTLIGTRPLGPNICYGMQRLPTESIGSVTISLSGVQTGSEIHIFDKDGVILASTESSSGTPAFSLQRYVSGSDKNTVRIFISSLAYENVDFNYELTASDATIPIFMRKDRNYKNPV